MKAFDDGSVPRRYAIAVRFRPIRGRYACRVEKIFSAPGNSMQRSAIFARGNFAIGLFGLSEREITRLRNDATEFRVEAMDALEVNLRQPFGRQLSLAQPARELRHGREGNILIALRKRPRIRI